MKKIYITLFSVLIFTSCKERHKGEQTNGLLSNFISITDNENNGIDMILDIYGGRCEYSIGAYASTVDGAKKYFKIEMSESDVIENRMNKVHLPSSNIAYMFYKNLKEEKKNYDSIHVVLISKDSSKQEFEFSISVLEQVENRMSLMNKIVNLLKEKQYEEFKKTLNNEVVPFDKEQLISRLKEVEPEFGNILEFRFLGFKIVPYKGKEILHLSGALMREKQNNEFSIDIDFDVDKDDLYQLQYKL
jgi:hypothetical protein